MNNSITKEMVLRFLKNESNKQELKLINRQIKNDPDFLTNFLDDDEIWNLPKENALSEKYRQEMWRIVRQRVITNKNNKFKWLAAACIIVIISGGVYLFFGNKAHQNISSSQITEILNKNIIENQGQKEKNIVLSDGSEVSMEPGAIVSYFSDFQTKRDVYLEGNARFKVAHDKIHPFTVYEEGIGTTALGTKFLVSKQNKTITVNLLEGKVVIRSFEKIFNMKSIYLIQGQGVSINKLNGAIVFDKIDKDHHSIITQSQKQKPFKGNTVWSSSAYTFSKTSLRNVIDRIQSRYQVVINIENINIEDYKFTGKIMYSDSLNTILDAICNINNLTYQRKGDTISISKK